MWKRENWGQGWRRYLCRDLKHISSASRTSVEIVPGRSRSCHLLNGGFPGFPLGARVWGLALKCRTTTEWFRSRNNNTEVLWGVWEKYKDIFCSILSKCTGCRCWYEVPGKTDIWNLRNHRSTSSPPSYSLPCSKMGISFPSRISLRFLRPGLHILKFLHYIHEVKFVAVAGLGKSIWGIPCLRQVYSCHIGQAVAQRSNEPFRSKVPACVLADLFIVYFEFLSVASNTLWNSSVMFTNSVEVDSRFYYNLDTPLMPS